MPHQFPHPALAATAVVSGGELGVEGDFLSATNYACATRWSSFRRFFMKSRQVSFYVQLHEVSQLMAAVQDHVIPRYEALPHFLGLTVIKCDSGHAPR